jgi:hypothetical protein
MAERFGSQTHPSGGQRFGSQTYAAASSRSGDLHATESGSDSFVATSLADVHGSLSVSESGSDVFASGGISSLLFTLQGHEAPTPDGFFATGKVTFQSVRFGSSVHPSGGLRFGTQAWAALGPNGPLAATETGSDTCAAVGFFLGVPYSFQGFDISAVFVDYSTESLGQGITGTLDDGYKVMLPVSNLGGVTFVWETNVFGNPSLRLADMDGATSISSVPWYVWNGSTWTAALFDVSDSLQGAAFLVEVGDDVASFNGAQTRYGSIVATETGEDFTNFSGSVIVAGSLTSTESAGADAFDASGISPHTGNAIIAETIVDTIAITGGVVVTGSVAAAESGADVLAASGGLSSAGSMAATEAGADHFAGSAGLVVTGALAATETAAADTAAGAGVLKITGALAVSESAADQLAVAGVLARIGTVTLLEGSTDVVAVVGAVTVTGIFAPIESADRFSSVGHRLIAGDLIIIEGSLDRFTGRGINGDLPPVADFDGPITLLSMTTRYVVRSKKKAAAA